MLSGFGSKNGRRQRWQLKVKKMNFMNSEHGNGGILDLGLERNSVASEGAYSRKELWTMR